MCAAKANKRCSRCGYYLPIDLSQCKEIESNMDLEDLGVKAEHAIKILLRKAALKCGVCGWRCEVVTGNYDRGCEHWWRDR